MNPVTGSTQNSLPHDHRWLTVWALDKNHHVNKDKLEKTTTTKLQQIHLYFCWAFTLFHQGIVITVTFKMLPTCLLKRQSKRYTKIKFCHKLSLINKLISLDKMVKSSKFMLQSQVSKWSEIADCLTILRRFFVKYEIPIYSAALTRKWPFVLP